MPILLDQYKIRKKPTSKSKFYFIKETNKMTILDETESIHENPQDEILNIDQSYNTPRLPLAVKTQKKHGDKKSNNSINEIRSQFKTCAVSMKGRPTFVEN